MHTSDRKEKFISELIQ